MLEPLWTLPAMEKSLIDILMDDKVQAEVFL